MEYSAENLKLAVILRTGRIALGWNQEQFAERLGISKAVVSKCESLDSAPKGELVMKAISLFQEHGIEINFLGKDDLKISFGEKVFEELSRSLTDAKALKRKKGKPGETIKADSD